MKIKTLLFALVAPLLSAFGQAGGGARPSMSTLPTFDTTATVVRREQTVSLDTLFAAAQTSPRGEFETTEAYRARMTAPAFTPLAVQFGGDFGAPTFKYDADKKEMRTSFYGTSSSSIPEFDAIIAGRYRESLGFVTGTNGFGAVFRYEKVKVRMLQFRPVSRVSMGVIASKSWALDSDSAQTLKPFLAAVLVLVPVAPDSGEFIWRNGSAFAATVSSPVESRGCAETITARTLSLWVYDSRDGRVLKKLDLTTGFSPSRPAMRMPFSMLLRPCE